MRFCFAGLGSIAGRHILNLKSMFDRHVEIAVIRTGKGGYADEEVVRAIDWVYEEKEILAERFDAVFITNPTFLHYETLIKYHDNSDAFFIEKPVFMTGEEDLSLFMDEKLYYVAAPLRYTKVIQYLKENIDFSDIYSIRCISSSYLPKWRCGTDYRNSYSASKEMGGGVSIDLIHEWDYLRYLVGMPKAVKCSIAKKSDLEISSDDLAVYIGEYDDKLVELHLDYFGRKTQRKIELIGRYDTVVADFVNGRIEFLESGKIVELREDRNVYQKKELKHFIDIINGNIVSDHGLKEACEILRLARGKR